MCLHQVLYIFFLRIPQSIEVKIKIGKTIIREAYAFCNIKRKYWFYLQKI